jgi:hypothetical protein
VNLVNPNPGILLSMTFTPAIPLFGTILPHEDFLALILLGDSCLHSRPFYKWLADCDVVTIRHQKHLVQLNLLPDFEGQFFNTEAMPNFGAVLPTATFHDYVHVCLQKEPASAMPV